MKFSTYTSAIMATLPLASSKLITASGNISLPDTDTTVLGNIYNHWVHLGNKSFDLTRSLIAPTTKPVTIPMTGSRKSALIEPSRSALVIIDMQNFFLHPELSPKAEGGRKAIEPTLKMIDGFRKNGMPVLWVNWGLNGRDLLDMPAAFLAGFSSDGVDPLKTFGSDMGNLSDGTAVGRKLMRGSWNAMPYGPLYDAQVEGVKNGTDYYFHKNRLSGLWGAQTPLGMWLEENQMTTLFFGGVNADQCVWGTFLDAYYKGYDVIYVDDIAATTSPEYATQMVKYNANLDGFLSSSSLIISALS
ncbi:Isochorismatase hydrolase [Lentithecium fluviatile CBS 122367]|uniref:Isochorismatase hydrolase n=1 Tax=Lentithecium fluviatile CBS 122367 TaxID=1168545 RepID=A0A6G1ITF9_9PLEO|nr:Isochorismatase hydrolase [Lentithecium fluviatile CBS 122367]